MAGHANAKTTRLYDRRNDEISVGESRKSVSDLQLEPLIAGVPNLLACIFAQECPQNSARRI